MISPRIFVVVLIAGVAFACRSEAGAPGSYKDRVKATATATKIDSQGRQKVTVTLNIAKGWQMFANPVGIKLLEAASTQITFTAKVKPIAIEVKYPPGKEVVDGKETYNIYTDRVVIEAVVQRATGDASPLQCHIEFIPTNGVTCGMGKITLTVQ